MSMMDSFKALEGKQKLMLVATLIIIGVAVYLAYGTFFSGTASSGEDNYTPSTPSQEQAAANTSITPTGAATSPSVAPTSSDTANTAGQLAPPVQQTANSDMTMVQPKSSAPTPEQLALLAQSQQLQEEYVTLVNQYQIAQLQQKLAQADATIAQSKLTTSKALLATQQIAGQLGTGAPLGMGGTSAKTGGAFQVMFVGKQQNTWTAMLGNGGSYFEVKIGTLLPDGSTVSDINDRGVTLSKDDGQRFLPLPKTFN